MKRSNIDQWICETEHWSDLTREKLEELQLFRLNQQLQRVKTRDGHYKDLPAHLNSLQELETLPFTTPEMLSEHPGSFLLTSQSEVSRVISGTTSGTTGPAKRVFYTKQDTEHTIGFFAAGIGEMAKPGDRVLISFPFSGSFGLGDLIEQAVLRLGAVPIRAGSCRTYQELCERIKQTVPDCYIGFPVPLLSAARFWQSDAFSAKGPNVSASSICSSTHPFAVFTSPLEFPIKRALISGDACPAGVVNALEQLLGTRLFPHYGSRETGLSGAITCHAHSGMHLKENHVIAEILDESMRPVADGSWGELVITTIGMEAMPLIRYRTGDHARFMPSPCPCGSLIKRLDMVSRRDPASHLMETLDSLIFSVPEVIDYQAAWENSGLHIRLYSTSGRCKGHIEQLLHDHAALLCWKEQTDYSLYSDARLFCDSIEISEKKCLPEDTFLYPGKRSVILPYSILSE